jgi:hypothetical protein
MDSVRDSVWASVGASVRDSVRDSVEASVRASVEASVRDSVEASVRASVWASVWASVGASVGASVRASVGDSVGDSCYGQNDAAWLGFYDYFNNVLKLEKQTEKLKGLWIIAQNAGWYLSHKNICWISERHDICNLKNGRIHCETGPAIAYPDGFAVYGLNGIRVPKWLIETPAEKIDIQKVFDETNADVQREIIRKIGVERLISKTDLLDTFTDQHTGGGNKYELRKLKIGNNIDRRYLHFEHASIPGVFYMKSVPPECVTALQARAWILSLVEREQIVNIKEQGIKELFPKVVS